MALEGALHFEVVAVVRIDKPSRDQQQNDFGGFELLLDCGIPLGPGFDIAVLPGANLALALEEGQVHDQVILKGFIAVGVGDKQRERGSGIGGHGCDR